MQLIEKSYDVKGRLKTVEDSVSGTSIYSYDNYDNISSVVNVNNSATVLTENYTYNANAELTQKAITGTVAQTYTYSYKDTAARELDYVGYGSYKFYPLTDVNGRNTGREIVNGTSKLAAEYITYRKVGDHATNMPASVWFGGGNVIKDSIKYKYDSCGNICEIMQNGHIAARYKYDSLNRLIREDNKDLNKTTIYTYDANGNIVERCEYAYTNKATDEQERLQLENTIISGMRSVGALRQNIASSGFRASEGTSTRGYQEQEEARINKAIQSARNTYLLSTQGRYITARSNYLSANRQIEQYQNNLKRLTNTYLFEKEYMDVNYQNAMKSINDQINDINEALDDNQHFALWNVTMGVVSGAVSGAAMFM